MQDKIETIPASLFDVVHLVNLVTIEIVARVAPFERVPDILDDIGSHFLTAADSITDERSALLLRSFAKALIATEPGAA